MSTAKELEILPGTPYSRYAIPLDYLPSRAYQARWGNGCPIQPLHRWFTSHADDYRGLIEKMRNETKYTSDIPENFVETALPIPAWIGGPYSPFDALALHTLIGMLRPRRYTEIGSGITTCFAHHAIKAHALNTVITSIDPQPRASIDNICDRVVREGLEQCDISIFDELEPNDILFFDGSHRSFMNSDVTVFFIDVLPRLKPGVVIHIHDITLPWDYPEMFYSWYWNEQYMLAVYLMGRMERINPLLPTAFVCREQMFSEDLRAPFVELTQNGYWNGGGAMWFTHLR